MAAFWAIPKRENGKSLKALKQTNHSFFMKPYIKFTNDNLSGLSKNECVAYKIESKRTHV